VHAVPSDPLFAYCPQDSDRWTQEVESISADVLFVGHTHIPFIRNVGNTTVVNPGSLGQPKTGRPLACYAVWEDGAISLKEYAYPIEETVHAIQQMPISKEDQEQLISVLMNGAIPAMNPEPITPDNDS
jgi:protein phosphatase